MKNKTTFIRLVFLFCMGMFGYYYFTDDTHEMIFFGVLTLINGQNLSDLNNNE
tara:strand:+ start:3731 stop:3889 length:159 start_codon:yes stop_codon:yes gene_type:complete